MSDAPVFLAGETLPASKAQSLGGILTPYTPALQSSGTQPVLGTGSVAEGSWCRMGGLVNVRLFIAFGTSGASAGTGTYYVSLPTVAPFLDVGIDRAVCGSGIIEDVSAASDLVVVPLWFTGDVTTQIRIGTAETSGWVSAVSPWAWAASDHIELNLWYPGDF